MLCGQVYNEASQVCACVRVCKRERRGRRRRGRGTDESVSVCACTDLGGVGGRRGGYDPLFFFWHEMTNIVTLDIFGLGCTGRIGSASHAG